MLIKNFYYFCTKKQTKSISFINLKKNDMRKIIFSALVATALFISSCEKNDNGSGGSNISLYGDWYESVYYHDPDNKGMRWLIPNACAVKTIWSISEKK